MNRNHFDGEMLQCPKCEKEFPSFYTSCPYCEAAMKSKAINKRGRIETLGLRVGALILALVLVAGGIYLSASMLVQGAGGFGREYALTTQEPESMQVGVTKQEVSIAGTGTDDTAEEEEPDALEGESEAAEETEDDQGDQAEDTPEESEPAA